MNDVSRSVNGLFARIAVDISRTSYGTPRRSLPWFNQHPSHRAVYAPRVPAGGHQVYFSIREICSAPSLPGGVKVLFKKKAEEHAVSAPWPPSC